ncbi:hypothetical protein IQ260_05330 [Leptolyngbya cf. ectocarpi LEGE 11479]|uniref:Uncharacterized protein n=1 Tax=Leptolyngbya cf. ectocarpi LEGE 11479 TaxID=1828722 RepID=A0A928ZQB1_LEPEC|nr:hypothetical protein [Leptolyngbya ectocarpi]MBE9066070.1 hypothetical protein [Leptolyngbya cf. ectocarpi LEGE 11479]
MITTLAGTTALYSAVRRRRRRAWQWWHQRQTAQLHKQAESIRDDLLQQTFAFRRYLESTLATHADTDQAEQWLERFQSFYQSLEQLSDRLSPPFIDDSLPLALQFMVQTWQHSHPGLTVKLDVPSDWPGQSVNNNPIILSVITGVIELLTPVDDYQLQIILERQDNLCTLTFKQENYQATGQKICASTPEITHLKEIFCGLTAGRLDIVTTETGLSGQLCWQDS